MATVIDYAAGVPSAAAIKGAGHQGAVRYISPPRPGTESWMKGKPMGQAEVQDLKQQGLDVAVVWQFGKEKHPDVMRGAVGGELDAKAAQAHLQHLGMHDWPVFFAVDFNITLAQWNEVAVHYFQAACKVLGRDRVGIYGHSRVCDWAREDGVIADLGDDKHLMWQTRSWSHGVIHNGAVLYQKVVDTPSSPGPRIQGVAVDVNDVLHPYWGQHPPGSASQPSPDKNKKEPSVSINPNPSWQGDPVWLADVLRLWGVKVKERDGWLTRGEGDFREIEGVMIHHTGSPRVPDRTSPDYVTNNPGVGGGLSANMFGHRDGVIELLGVGIAYHAGAADPGKGLPGVGEGYVTRNSVTGPKQYTTGNAKLLAIEPQNSGREPWEPELYDAMVRMAAAITWFLGKPVTVSTVPGHKEYAPSRKVDPSFSMPEFRRAVQAMRDNPPFNERTFMSLTDAQQMELLELTRNNNRRLEALEDQIMGPEQSKRAEKHRNPKGGRGWPQLGSNAAGLWLTLVDAVAAIREDLAAIQKELKK